MTLGLALPICEFAFIWRSEPCSAGVSANFETILCWLPEQLAASLHVCNAQQFKAAVDSCS